MESLQEYANKNLCGMYYDTCPLWMLAEMREKFINDAW